MWFLLGVIVGAFIMDTMKRSDSTTRWYNVPKKVFDFFRNWGDTGASG